ncbi:MAG: DUF308 domain-containing protein [Bacteroidales bacterium]|nr:DUF308 domain-containing protein [Bacteroidales bacterium]
MSFILVRNWGIYLFHGLLAVIYGLIVLFVPAETLQALGWYSGLVILLSGILVLLVTGNRISKKLPFLWLLIQGLLYVTAGILIMVYTQSAIELFVSTMGILALVVGIMQLIVLVNLKQAFRPKNLILFNALVTLGFGVLMLFNPFRFAQAIIVLSGILALFFGIILIWFSIRLRTISRMPSY